MGKYSNFSILIIEDDEDDYILLKELLVETVGDIGAIDWAEDFKSAQQKIASEQFDFYFLDNHLGAELGLELIVEIKQRYETAPPIVMLSGVNDYQTDLDAMEKGADDYLIKSELTPHLLERTFRYSLKSKDYETKLAKLAHFDGLTGLYNRSIFNELLIKSIHHSERSGNKFALVTLDLDNFKFINDHYGHPAGDQLLTKIARRLKHSTRSSDIVARIGGDEFSLLLKDVKSNSDFVMLIENIMALFQAPIQIDSKSVSVTTSAGIAIYPDDTKKANELIDHSDRAMYQAKSLGRNTYSFYNQQLHQEAITKHQLEVELNDAINNNLLLLYYQPIVSLATTKISSYEALLRWPDHQGGFRNTEEFIEIAEESSLILQIGDWVFQHACLQLKLWSEQGIDDRHLSINVSANQFETDDFSELVIKHLKATPNIAQQITFELTERKPLVVSTTTINRLQKLAALGFTFSVDDFGIGHSSISYLRAFPMATIKIDKSITQNILTSKEDLALCTAIIALGKALSLGVIAEGVETQEIASILIELACPYAQGYLYAKPLPL
ncbi:MAG: GGDEF domain-containing response regulator [Gammaproteobacteria bacterium]|nr:GGDEF domain-containing response regulator [Gammaproteobacteria bacterium]